VPSAEEELDFIDFNVDSYSAEDCSSIVHATEQLDFSLCYCSVLGVDTGKRESACSDEVREGLSCSKAPRLTAEVIGSRLRSTPRAFDDNLRP
jgi:hypothetical protein